MLNYKTSITQPIRVGIFGGLRLEGQVAPVKEKIEARNKQTFKHYFSTEEKSICSLPDNLLKWRDVLLESKSLSRRYQEAADKAEAHILLEMKNHEEGVFSDGTQFTKRTVKRNGYSVEPCTYTQLVYQPKKETGEQ